MTEGMQRLWEDKFGILLCLIFALATSSVGMMVWIIFILFFTLVMALGRWPAMLSAIVTNSIFFHYFPELLK